MRAFLSVALALKLVFALEVGKVDEFSGKVDRLKRGEVRAVPIQTRNFPLLVGDIVRTKTESSANLSFIDGNRVQLGPLSRLDVLEYQDAKRVNIPRGRVLFEITRLRAGQGFEVRTPTAILGVKGTRFLVDVTPSATLVRVFSGVVELSAISDPNTRVLATEGSIYSVTSLEVRRVDTLPLSRERAPLIDIDNPPDPQVSPPCPR
ncbi:MAG: FecR family protein [Aquificaceae bacterium]